MWILIILQLIILIILVFLLIAGPILMLAGFFWQNKKRIRLGFRFFMVPFVLVSSILIHHAIWKLAIKPNKQDLIGHYELTNSSASKNGKATLHLYENGTFEKTFLANHGASEKGKYTAFDNEIWFRSDSHGTVAKIDKGFIDFKLKFITNINPNSNENLIFEKVGD
ncbi:hypothetical protein [Flavobacterium sp.]|uniref:hypothetical protein n=1 Tax=Flavobacterium sp. TaxID=239 RepID=UPI00286A7FC6|nr:hypothetical protein [Flavobacterium sp.]